jgi:hypothetical protein
MYLISLTFCGVSLSFNAKDIILGLTEHSLAQGTINNALFILKYRVLCRAFIKHFLPVLQQAQRSYVFTNNICILFDPVM